MDTYCSNKQNFIDCPNFIPIKEIGGSGRQLLEKSSLICKDRSANLQYGKVLNGRVKIFGICNLFLMGIHGLSKVISECAPRAIKQHNIGEYFGRKIAIDASMSIYQFLIAVRSEDGSMLADENGKTTRFNTA